MMKPYETTHSSQDSYHYLLALARQDNATAQFSLGLLHEHGEGVIKDKRLASKWYERAARQEHYLCVGYSAFEMQ